ncbi:MAG: FAD-dependent oxidoreductase [Gemmataceae bacterium]|nr:FAD-dependent oxidoreductase [Gemmataceae bacterium]
MAGRVVVVGGGVVGACSAYYLARAGWRVTVLDRGGFGKGCSHANCGYVCPSHVLPLAAPGAVRSTLKTLFARNSPLKVRPAVVLKNPGWFLGFARRCNGPDMLAAGRAIQALLTSSRVLFDELIAAERLECEWETKGLLFVFRSRAAFDHYTPVDELLTATFGTPARRLDADALLALEPALLPGNAGGYLYESDAHLRPDRLMGELRRVLTGLGVEVRENAEVTGFVREGGAAKAARTAAGDAEADEFVVAAGAWTPQLNRELGCRVPIQPGKGYSVTMPRPAVCPTYPLIFEEHRVAVTPFRSGYRLGSTMEFAGYDATMNRSRLGILTGAAKLYLRDPLAEPVQEEWWGWRPMTPDGLPVIDRSPSLGNVLIAAGHNMLGLSMATGTGRLVAELVGREKPHLDPTPYRLSRF